LAVPGVLVSFLKSSLALEFNFEVGLELLLSGDDVFGFQSTHGLKDFLLNDFVGPCLSQLR